MASQKWGWVLSFCSTWQPWFLTLDDPGLWFCRGRLVRFLLGFWFATTKCQSPTQPGQLDGVCPGKESCGQSGGCGQSDIDGQDPSPRWLKHTMNNYEMGNEIGYFTLLVSTVARFLSTASKISMFPPRKSRECRAWTSKLAFHAFGQMVEQRAVLPSAWKSPRPGEVLKLEDIFPALGFDMKCHEISLNIIEYF